MLVHDVPHTEHYVATCWVRELAALSNTGYDHDVLPSFSICLLSDFSSCQSIHCRNIHNQQLKINSKLRDSVTQQLILSFSLG